ncbi:hypothetical protein CCZ01_05950 [Helicobacter monodelphidis]|uniref:HP0495 family protein n=1 Tax=Helicobacter sp. 15-1451 TaxID=2004995 RepID=UPI000DCF466D|nr:DUF493 domain-containing protein [Helicobacter sp. 15-1451]RAX57523.1 hypothetical protein CCZ01_05950 [Helicobacter sp. 15-1451]
MQKLQLEYPCKWSYKIIGSDKQKMEEAVFEILESNYELIPSRASLTGKYYSIEINTEVKSEEERYRIFFKLKDCEHIRFVL